MDRTATASAQPMRDRMAALLGRRRELKWRRAGENLLEVSVMMCCRAAMVGAVAFSMASGSLFAATTEVLRNEKVDVTEWRLQPGEQAPLPAHHASVVVYMTGDAALAKMADGTRQKIAVQRGKAVDEAARAGMLVNTGREPLRFVRVEFLSPGAREMWGMTGLPPNYNMIFEDEHSRTYNIRIAAHEWEPQHTHHNRVVVCLSGAKLEHVLPDGSVQPSTLKTDEVDWRPAQTHKGHNIGDTNLWVVAIEPK